MTATITNACRLCEGKTQNILDLGWTPLANALCDKPTPNVPRYPLTLARCDSCGHFQLPVRVDPAELFPPTYPYASGASASMRQHLDEVARLVFAKIPSGGRVLEVGCNDGYLLGQLSRLGLEAVGVDPAASDDAVRRFSVIREPWGERDLPVGEFDAVVALNVFAHVADLRRSIEQCAAVLKPGGHLMFEVGYFPAMVEQNVFDTIYHEHLDYHTLGALMPFLARLGLMVFDAERIPVQGGSIRVWAMLGQPRESWRLENLLVEETASAVSLESYADAVHETPRDLSGYLSSIAFARKWFRERNIHMMPLIGYGCPAKATTLTATCGLSPSFYVDDNPLKSGKFTADGQCRILPNTREIDEQFGPGPRRQATVLVFAWNMLDEILPKIRNSPARCLREARVLVPFPEPHYVE